MTSTQRSRCGRSLRIKLPLSASRIKLFSKTHKLMDLGFREQVSKGGSSFMWIRPTDGLQVRGYNIIHINSGGNPHTNNSRVCTCYLHKVLKQSVPFLGMSGITYWVNVGQREQNEHGKQSIVHRIYNAATAVQCDGRK